jgi:hypothetical protein
MRSLAALAIAAAACSGTAANPAANPKQASVAATPAPDDGPVAKNTALAPGERVAGVPHLSAIERIVLSPAGDAAITRDSAGRLRFWPAIDGSAEPLPIPIGSASHFALSKRGDGTFTIALVDTAGAAHILRAYANGVIERVFDLPPKLNVVDVEVLPGGGRFALLRADRVIELRDTRGNLLARHDRRGFRPERLRLAGRDTLVALELDIGAKESTVGIHRLKIASRGAKLALVPDGEGYDVSVKSFAIGAHQSGVSPSAKHFAFISIDKTSNWEAVVVDLEAREHRAISMAAIARHETPALGFVGDGELIARGGANGATWLIELGTDSMRPMSVRPDTAANAPRAFAKNLVVAGLGNWLYTYRTDTRRSRYIGYELFSPMSAVVSPSGELFAWGSGNDLFVTSASGQRIAQRQLLRGQSVRYITFVDERRILIAYYTAALELYDYKSGEIIDAVDGGGSFTAGGYDPAREMFYTIPQPGHVWITEVQKDGLRGPHVIADGAMRAGFLDGTHALWTADNHNRLRLYTAAEIRKGLPSSEILERGALLSAQPINLGRDGRIFAMVYNSGRNNLAAYAAPAMPGPEEKPDGNPATGPRLDLSKTELAQVPSVNGIAISEVAPTGDRIAVVSNNVVFVRDDKLKVVWSYPFPNGVRSLSWNATGTHLSVATQEAAVVFEATDGKPLSTDCGPLFSARATPPANLFPPNVQASVCERP